MKVDRRRFRVKGCYRANRETNRLFKSENFKTLIRIASVFGAGVPTTPTSMNPASNSTQFTIGYSTGSSTTCFFSRFLTNESTCFFFRLN